MNTTGWNSKADPSNHKPNGICASVQPLYTQNAIVCTRIKDIGIGVPSKY
jgi:hypothetical protein